MIATNYSSRWRRTISKLKKHGYRKKIIPVGSYTCRKPFQTHQNDVHPHIRNQIKQLSHEMIIESNR